MHGERPMTTGQGARVGCHAGMRAGRLLAVGGLLVGLGMSGARGEEGAPSQRRAWRDTSVSDMLRAAVVLALEPDRTGPGVSVQAVGFAPQGGRRNTRFALHGYKGGSIEVRCASTTAIPEFGVFVRGVLSYDAVTRVPYLIQVERHAVEPDWVRTLMTVNDAADVAGTLGAKVDADMQACRCACPSVVHRDTNVATH